MADTPAPRLSRRAFLQSTVVPALDVTAPAAQPAAPRFEARWIWYPERRTLASTFVFFRKEFDLAEPTSGEATGWVSANSRYMLFINGQFVQRGPAACDPRYWDVDPVTMSPYLRKGRNVVAAIACFFGGGDGTYVPGTPLGDAACAGFLFQAEITDGGAKLKLLSDGSWKAQRARCWPAGGYQRWYLKALQERFDARLYPEGWNGPGFDASRWRRAAVLTIELGRPVLKDLPPEMWQDDWRLAPRTIPLMIEKPVLPVRTVAVGWVDWNVPPVEYFDCFTEDAFVERPDRSVLMERSPGKLFPLKLAAPGKRSAVISFDFNREVCGFPFVRFRAPAGTVVELLFVESQDPSKLLLRTAPQFGQWIRVVARDGETRYEAFEWDVLRYLQVAVRGSDGPVEVLEAGVTERTYPYPYEPDLKTPDGAINRAIEGTIRTHLVTSQDTIVDNVTRERQQYAGDVDHAKLTSYYGFGEYRQAARMIRTYAQGQNKEGWFKDCWPAWDRCERLWQKSLGLTQWGPILDHGVNFVIATALHYLFSGDRATVEKVYPRFLLFDRFLTENVGLDGLLPVEWIRNSVWIDHRGFETQADKQAAFNIYYVGMLLDGIARLAEWMNDRSVAESARARAAQLTERIRTTFWSGPHSLLVDNLPRIRDDGEMRLHERTLAMALLFGVVPEGCEERAVEVLANLPTAPYENFYPVANPRARIGCSFPANAGWRLWALSRFGRGDTVVRDLQERWGRMPSLLLNGTFSENWVPKLSESGQVWCQNGPVVLYILYGDVIGIRPTAPGFKEFDVRPQLGALPWIEGTVHSPLGPIHARCEQNRGGWRLSLTVPGGVRPAIVVPAGLTVRGAPLQKGTATAPGTTRWTLPDAAAARTWELSAERE